MSDDIGVGDVVERIKGSPRRSRYVVAGVDPGLWVCPYGCKYCSSIWIDPDPIMNGRPYAACAFRKIGGSQTDTVRRFTEDLTPARPTVDA